MSSAEKKVAAVLVVLLIAMLAVYVSTSPKPQPPNMVGPGQMRPAGQTAGQAGTPAGAGGDAESAACVTGGGDSVATQEFGKKGAKMEIVALLPITHGCHVNTEAELEKAYKKHPDDIHLTIVDFFGPDAPKYQEKVGAGRALVSINGKTSFKLKGKTVTLERQENMSYRPADIVPIIEQELKAK
jgi:hypothetical protein